MQAELLRKYLARAPATPKGRMRRPRKGLRSTRKEKKGRRERMQAQEEEENELHIENEDLHISPRQQISHATHQASNVHTLPYLQALTV